MVEWTNWQKFRAAVDTAGTYFIDPTYKVVPVDNVEIDKFYLSMLALNYVLRGRILVSGEPGSGKTVSGNIIHALFGHTPVVTANDAQMNCAPDQTINDLVGRLHFGKMGKEGIEQAIWQKSLLFPFIHIDELNRLTETRQDNLLNGINSGLWTRFNETIAKGQVPIFATINNPDNGTFDLIPPIADRFDLMVEAPTGISVLDLYQADGLEKEVGSIAHGQIEDLESGLQMLVREFDTVLSDTNMSGREKIAKVTALRGRTAGYFAGKAISYQNVKEPGKPFLYQKKNAVYVLTEEEQRAIRTEIKAIPFNSYALVYFEAVNQEVNNSDLFGWKRVDDPQPKDGVDINFATSQVKTGISPRAIARTFDLARGVAWLAGSPQVRIQHMQLILPYVLAHRVRYQSDFIGMHRLDRRGETLQEKASLPIYLARCLMSGIDERWQNSGAKVISQVIAYRDGKTNDLPDLSVDVKDDKGKKQGTYPHPMYRHMQEVRRRQQN